MGFQTAAFMNANLILKSLGLSNHTMNTTLAMSNSILPKRNNTWHSSNDQLERILARKAKF